MDEKKAAELLMCTKALLLLQIMASTKSQGRLKPEIVLARAGFTPREIANMTGKKPAAVAKAIQRAGREAA